ncbi:MAG: hypothetical protein JW889_16135 [Verrucomicrobia bacterium]|nr:hypothetical protein [Verrucomicrobiota bacterium]
MNGRMGGVLVVLVVVFGIVAGYRFISTRHRTHVLDEQKRAYDEGLVTNRVWCEACGTVSEVDVPFTQRRKFLECPSCHEMKARPITYWYCTNESCNRQLTSFPNHVWDNGYNASPFGAPNCPACGQANHISPEELHLSDAKRIAEETGQPFPPERNW